jgi:hypothetical protein
VERLKSEFNIEQKKGHSFATSQILHIKCEKSDGMKIMRDE